MLTLTDDELGEPLPDIIKCPRCGGAHRIENSENSEPPFAQFYRCGNVSYMAGWKGRSIMHKFENGE